MDLGTLEGTSLLEFEKVRELVSKFEKISRKRLPRSQEHKLRKEEASIKEPSRKPSSSNLRG